MTKKPTPPSPRKPHSSPSVKQARELLIRQIEGYSVIARSSPHRGPAMGAIRNTISTFARAIRQEARKER